MIKTALFSRYRIKEFIQFINNTLLIVKKHGPDKLRVKALYLALLQNHESLKKIYKQDAMNEITPQLVRLDEKRDRAIVCLRQVCEGYTNHPNEKQKAAGQKILDCIDKYGSKLYNLNYSAETAALHQLAHDFQTDPECVSALQTLHMEEVVNAMNAANKKFEKLFVDRLEIFSAEQAKSTRDLLQLSAEAYKTLMQHLEAHATLAPSAEYTSIINHINENIEHFNQMVEKRKSGLEPEEAAPMDDEAVDTPSM